MSVGRIIVSTRYYVKTFSNSKIKIVKPSRSRNCCNTYSFTRIKIATVVAYTTHVYVDISSLDYLSIMRTILISDTYLLHIDCRAAAGEGI